MIEVQGHTKRASPSGGTRIAVYSAAGLSFALSYQCFGTYVQFFYIDVLKLAAGWVGLAMVLYGIWNGLNDPLAGYISDGTRTRWGRRIPYIAFGSAPLALCFTLVWTPPFGAGQGQAFWLFVYFLTIIFLFDTLWTFIAINWTALFPEMFPDPERRARVSGWRQFFAVPGLILGIALAPVVYGSLGWGWMGVIFGLVTCAFLYVSLLDSSERPEFQQDQPLGLREALRATFANRSFCSYLIANFGIQFTFLMITATLPFYAKYVLGFDEAQTSAILGAAFVTVLPCLYLRTKTTQRFGPRWALLTALAFFGVALLSVFVVDSFWSSIAAFMALGVGLAGLLMLPDLLIADVVDEDELQTGVRREGMYFGVNGLIIRLAIAVQSVVLTQTLHISGYVGRPAGQPDSALWGLRLLMSAVPLVALIGAFLATRAYALDGDRLAQIKIQVAGLHSKKKAAQ